MTSLKHPHALDFSSVRRDDGRNICRMELLGELNELISVKPLAGSKSFVSVNYYFAPLGKMSETQFPHL